MPSLQFLPYHRLCYLLIEISNFICMISEVLEYIFIFIFALVLVYSSAEICISYTILLYYSLFFINNLNLWGIIKSKMCYLVSSINFAATPSGC